MFKTLHEFYLSGEWRGLRAALIAERASPKDEIVYDEHNGKPLYHGYDIVAHHKIPLTLANVNDYSISLNPENIMLVSHQSHNEIHARFGYSTQKKVYYIYGPPCGGKSTFVATNKGSSDLVVDIDLIWQAITGGALYDKPDALKTPVFTARNALLDIAATRAGNWMRAWVIEGGAVKPERERRIAALSAEPIYIEADKETCYRRLASDKKREGVQEQWRHYIDEWFDRFQPDAVSN